MKTLTFQFWKLEKTVPKKVCSSKVKILNDLGIDLEKGERTFGYGYGIDK